MTLDDVDENTADVAAVLVLAIHDRVAVQDIPLLAQHRAWNRQ